MVKNNQNLVLKMFLLLKYQKLLTFLVKNPKQYCHVFLSAFIWNHPYTSVRWTFTLGPRHLCRQEKSCYTNTKSKMTCYLAAYAKNCYPQLASWPLGWRKSLMQPIKPRFSKTKPPSTNLKQAVENWAKQNLKRWRKP